jgi:hypothetical protein
MANQDNQSNKELKPCGVCAMCRLEEMRGKKPDANSEQRINNLLSINSACAYQAAKSVRNFRGHMLGGDPETN